MRVALLEHFGPPSALRVKKRPDLGVPGPGRLLVEVDAAGVSIDDVFLRMGLDRSGPSLPLVPGREVCGRVRAIGDGVRGVAVGERVCGLAASGGYAEQCHLEAELAFKAPLELDPATLVSLPQDYVGAWLCLEELARVRAGEQILVVGADEGPGRALVELAARAGVTVYAIGARGDELRALGAAEVLAREEAVARLGELTGGRGVAALFDTEGGDADAELVEAVGLLGRIVYVGFRSLLDRHRSFLRALYKVATMPRFGALELAERGRAVMGLSFVSLLARPDLIQRAYAALREDLVGGALRPRVDRIYPLEEVAAAHGRFQDRAHHGKIVLDPRS